MKTSLHQTKNLVLGVNCLGKMKGVVDNDESKVLEVELWKERQCRNPQKVELAKLYKCLNVHQRRM